MAKYWQLLQPGEGMWNLYYSFYLHIYLKVFYNGKFKNKY